MAALAEGQHGRVARRQLLAMGIGARSIEHRLACRRLHPVHPGVYAVGHRLTTQRGRWMAAVLAAGPGAVLSHTAAAALWGIRQPGGRIDVSGPRRRRLGRGVVVHCSRVAGDERTTVDRIPVTTVPRTLLDLATCTSRQQLATAFHEAEVHQLSDPLTPAALLARHPRRRGAAAVRAVLAERDLGAGVTRSALERRFREILAPTGLPRPERNAVVLGRARDCVWPEQRLVVELDGRSAHATVRAFEVDRARDRALTVAGWRVVRITWRQLDDDGPGVVADLRALLAWEPP